MKYGITYIICGLAFAYMGLQSNLIAQIMLCWLGISMFLVGVAYLLRFSTIFGKNNKGNLGLQSFTILLPYILFTWIIWHIQRVLSREDIFNEIAPGIFLGRRVLPSELPDDISVIVDLTAEFIEPKSITNGKQYYCLPTLDGTPPNKQKFTDLISNVAKHDDNVYIHCAVGHGRSALIVAGLLLSKEITNTVNEAIDMIKSKRPKIGLHKTQQNLLKNVFVNKYFIYLVVFFYLVKELC